MANDVQYITFENGAPRAQFPGTWTDDQIRGHLKSEQFENSMAEKGYLYKYGLNPVNLLEEENLDDNSFQAGAKSAIDTLKQIGQGALGVMYDTFGMEEKQQEAIDLVKQYQLDQAAHLWRKDKEGQVKPRFNTLEQVFESEDEFGAFLDWVGAKLGEGMVTTLPFVLAGIVTGGIGAGAIGAGLIARQAGMGALKQAFTKGLMGAPGSMLGRATSMSGLGFMTAGYTFGAGDTYVNQLAESDDPNAAIALAAGIPYAAAEGAFGAGSIFLSQLAGKVGKNTLKKSLLDQVKRGEKISIKKNIKRATKGKRLKELGKGILAASSGEATAEALQEGITQTGQQLESGRSLSEMYASPDFWKQVGEAAAAGAVGGGPFGVAGGTVAALRVGPSMDIKLDASGQIISTPVIERDVSKDLELWESVDFIVGDEVTFTGAGIETKVTEDQQPSGDNFNQPNATNQPTPTYNVVGTTELEGKKYFLLEGTAGRGDMFVPVTQKNQILNLDDGTIDEGKYNNSEGFKYNQDTSEDVDLNSEEVQEAWNFNKKRWQAKGYVDKDTDKAVNDYFEEAKNEWVEEELTDVTQQRIAQDTFAKLYNLWVANGQPKLDRFEMFFDDGGNPLTLIEAMENEEYLVEGSLQKYEGVADEQLKNRIETKGWEQERYKRLQGLNENEENYISDDERTEFNRLGYAGPFGQQYLDDLIADTKVIGRSRKTRGRKRLDQLLNDNIRFEQATEGIRERQEKITGEPTIIQPLTPEERQSQLGEGIFDKSPGERIRELRVLLEYLDQRGWTYITALEAKEISQLRAEKKALLFSGNLTKANAVQDKIDRIKQKQHIILMEDRIVGTYSSSARSGAERHINYLKTTLPKKRENNPERFDLITGEITLYQRHIDNIDKARVRFNELLATFNEEPVLSNEWNKVSGRSGAISRIRKLNRDYAWEKPNNYTRRYELWAKNAGQPRLKEDFADNGPKVLQTLKNIINGMALDIKVDLQPFLESDGVALAGQYILGERGVRVAYNAVPELRPGLNRTDSINYILHHEVMHLLRTEGFFTQREWSALARQATDKWMKQYNIAERHPELSREEQIEEAISDAFAEYMTGRYQTGGVIAKVFTRLKQYLIALGNALTQNRFDTGAAIFNAIDRGIVGSRYESMERTSEIYNGGINANSILVKQPWSGENIVGFAPRTRALFTKQPTITNVKNWFRWWNSGGRPSTVATDTGAPLVVMHTTLKDTTERFYKGPIWAVVLVAKGAQVTPQRITSKKTARPQVAGLITALVESGILQPGSVNADIGGGPHELGTEKFLEAEVVNVVYDPFNRTKEKNKAAVELIKNGQADTVTLANLLNVIEEPAIQRQKLAEAFNAVKVGGQVFITVHYDSKKKAGSTTMGYQQHKPLSSYLPMVKELFPTAIIQNIKGRQVIVATKLASDKPTGAPFEVFDRSNDMGYHFTATQRHVDFIHDRNGKLASDYYTFKGFLNIKNPYRMPDFNVWHTRDILALLEGDGMITAKQLENWPSNLSDDEVYKRIVNILKDNGYDGIVYQNVGEDLLAQRAQMRPPGEVPINPADVAEELANPPQDSWIAFEPQQFKSVYNEGPYGIRNPNMMAARQWQKAAGEKPVDEYKKMNRQQKRSLNAKMAKEIKEEETIWTEDNRNYNPKKLSLFSRIAGFVREWAKDNVFFERVYKIRELMNYKARSIQAAFTRMLFHYNAIISDPALRELIYRAQAISAFYPNQKFRRDENGRIVFRAPVDMKDGPRDLDIKPGEIVILEGDLATAYEDYQAAIAMVTKEQMKGVIAGAYTEPLREAIQIINFHRGRALSEVYAPDFSNDITNEQIENMEYPQILSIITALERLSEVDIEMDWIDRSALNDFALDQIRTILGKTSEKEINKSADLGLYKLLSEFKKYEEWKQGDYVPLMRYGKYYVAVINKNEDKYIPAEVGEFGSFVRNKKLVKHNPAYLLNYQQFESKKEADLARTKLTAQYRTDLNTTVTAVSEVNIKEIKERIAAGTAGIMDVAQYLSDPKATIFNDLKPELDQIIKQNKNITGFDTFITPRQQLGGVPGYTGDFGRAAGQFGFMGSRAAARNRFYNEALGRKDRLQEYIDETNDKQMQTALDKWWAYEENPKQEFASLRRMGFWWYLGGNMSSALLQIMSAVQFTGPILAQFSNSYKAGSALVKAHADALHMLSFSTNGWGDTFIDWDKAPADLKQAILEDMPTYLKQGQALQESGQVPGKAMMDEKTALRQFENLVIGGMFNTMESVSRLTGYIAAYRLTQDAVTKQKALELFEGDNLFLGMVNDNGGVVTSQIIARHIIDDTFGVYGKINRPQIMRGFMAVPALFQTYIGQMFALMNRMLTKGATPAQKAAGRKVFARMMLMLIMTGGLFGLPGSDDAEELANWMIEKAPIVGTGLKTDMRAAMREMLYDAGFSAGMINAMENGLVEAGLGISIQRRISLGQVPGSNQVRGIASMLGLTSGGSAADFVGAPGSVFVTPIKESITAAREGRGFVDVAFKSAPLFIRNGYKAYEMAIGKGFVETNYGNVLADDPSMKEALYQAMGFGSARMKREREAMYQERLNQTRNQSKKNKFNAQITNAYRDIFVGAKIGNSGLSMKGQERLNELTRELWAWNNKQDIQDMIFVDLQSLVQQAIEATYQMVRTINAGNLNIAKNLKQRKALGLE